MDKKELASIIEHSILKPEAIARDILRGCAEAKEQGFHAVCVNPCRVALAKDALGGSGVKVVSVIGFPLGASTIDAKLCEAMGAVTYGADELDIVMNIGLAKEGRWGEVEQEIRAVVMAAPRVVHKVIIETAYLSKEEVRLACEASVSAGAEFVKTSTGFAPRGATVEDVRLIRDFLHGRAGIKAAGGIRDLKTALALIEAGADRLGTSSGVKIVSELKG